MSDNELIAEFMGLVREEANKTYNKAQYWLPVEDKRYKGRFVGYYDSLHYHEFWDWLMPVVEKIEKSGAIVEMNICLAAHCRIFAINKKRSPIREFINGGSISLLESTYLSVVEFIKYYNQTPKP